MRNSSGMMKRSLDQNVSEVVVKKRRVSLSQKNGARWSSQFSEEDAQTVSGIILKIELRNFMNHAHLAFDFAPKVNFVTGRNGTGKSALLTGLVVGLGGKASATCRGNQLHGFIQDNKNVSEIKVTLHNGGMDSYQPEVYGDSITVVRKLIRGGGGDYKILAHNGTLVSTKKQDLQKILECLNIQVENPICILNQETAKNFLCSKNPTDRYKFFVKATQIEQMMLGYEQANSELRKTEEVLRVKESALPTMEVELKQVQDRAQALESLDKLRHSLDHKSCEMAWAIVAEKEAILETKARKLTNLDTARPKYEKKVAESEKRLQNCREKKKDIEEVIRKMGEESDKIKPQIEAVKAKLLERKTVARSSADALRQCTRDLQRLKNDEQQLQKRIQDIRSRAEEDTSAQHRERSDAIARCNKSLMDAEQERADCKAKATKAHHTLTALRDQKNELLASQGECERVKHHHQLRIQQMERARNNSEMRFGKFWPQLVAEVEKLHKEGRFHQKPYGPLGAHLKVKDMNYALAAEVALGNMVNAFFVTDQHDKKIVDEIKARVCRSERGPEVLIGAFMKSKHNISKMRAQTKHPTLADMVDFDEAPVFNCFVDQLSIQNIVLILDGIEARRFMKERHENCAMCYDKNGDQILANPFRVYSSKQDRPRFLSANMEEDIRIESLKLAEVNKTLSDVSKRLDDINQQIQSLHNEHRNYKPKEEQMDKKVQKLKLQLQELQEQEAEEDNLVDHEQFQSDLEELHKEIERVSEGESTASADHEANKLRLEAAEKEFSEASARIKELQALTDPVKNDLVNITDMLERAETETSHYMNELNKFDDTLKQEKEEFRAYKALVQKDIDNANIMSERMVTRKSPKSLHAEIQNIESQLCREEALRGNADEIRTSLEQLTLKYNIAKSDINHCKQYTKAMGKALKLRSSNMETIIKGTVIRAKTFFISFLGQRNYNGKLEFDFKEEKLDIVVWPSASQQADMRDLKGLSGGEKSFSTLCFMLSLWESVSSPFRCMDEFDVFMDMVNRRISMKLLLEFAKDKPNYQFILLTPHDTSQIDVNDAVHIYRMPDTVRGTKRNHDESNPHDRS